MLPGTVVVGGFKVVVTTNVVVVVVDVVGHVVVMTAGGIIGTVLSHITADGLLHPEALYGPAEP
jgi:hypothetical protein